MKNGGGGRNYFWILFKTTPHIHILPQDEKWLKKCERIFQFSLQTINALGKEAPPMAMKLFLQGALTADQVGDETISYEFISQVGVAKWARLVGCRCGI